MTEAARDLSSLQFRVEGFAASHLPLVAAFSRRYWTRPQTESFFNWRYLDALPLGAMFVAVTDDECLGQICSLRKQYLIEGEQVPCLEIFDWHSLPGLKGSGVGVRVMRALMREGVRLMGVGGTPDVLRALPAMGWQTIGQALTFELPLVGEVLLPGLRERAAYRIPGERLALNAATALWFRPKVRAFDGRAVQVAQIGVEVQDLYRGDTGYDVLQVPNEAMLKWTTAGHPGTGAYRIWYFTVQGRLRGWALTRLYETEEGREAAIIEIFAPLADVALYAWMVSEVATSLAADRPRIIRARATCPVLQGALSANRFRVGLPVPVHTWPKLAPAERRLHITLNHSDAPFRPYPTAQTATGFLV